MKVRIKVTKEIIAASANCGADLCPTENHGTWSNNQVQNCAIAIAVKEIIPNAYVFKTNIANGPSLLKTDYLIALPHEATTFIRYFDMYKPERRLQMEPLEFDIILPDSIIDSIGLDEVYEILNKSETLELVP